MPSLMLRKLNTDLVARLKAYARRREQSTTDAAADLIAYGLDQREARTAGADAVNQSRTAEERSDAARKAATARWARETRP